MRRIQIELIVGSSIGSTRTSASIRSASVDAVPLGERSTLAGRRVTFRSSPSSASPDRRRARRRRARCRRARRRPCGAAAAPIPARPAGRQRRHAELEQQQGQRPAEQRGVEEIGQQMIEAEPQRGRRRELGVAAADPAAREEGEGDGQNDAGGADMQRTSVRPCRWQVPARRSRRRGSATPGSRWSWSGDRSRQRMPSSPETASVG